MLERAELALKVACIVLAAVVIYEAVHLVKRFNPLQGVTIPAVPSLTASTNAPGTNLSGTVTSSTNVPSAKAGESNAAVPRTASMTASNAVASQTNSATGATNLAASSKSLDTNLVATVKTDSNTVMTSAARATLTNIVMGASSNLAGTNLSALTKSGGTNTNVMVLAQAPGAGTNTPAAAGGARRGSSPSTRPGGPGGGRGPELPPEAKKRVDWVVRSETLAPIIRPQPMGLLGIAGDRAFIRAPNGQTDMVKEGDTLGGIKLVKIGVNRVLVEEDGQPKELMIYEGYGGESLLPKSTAKTNETSATPPRSTASLSPAVTK